MILYRPIGIHELRQIRASGFRQFPQRLPSQPIFYPVLSIDYARMIARDWNTEDQASGYVGFVTRFEVDDEYISRFPIQVVGGRSIEELWVPAEQLAEFNSHLAGEIEILESYAGQRYLGRLDPLTHLPLE